MEDVFKSFCAFGAGGKDGAALMDNAKFAKLARDLKLLDKKVTATDVDIIFSKVKAKTERKINFAQFTEGMKLIADKKYPGDTGGVQKLEAKILQGKSAPSTGQTTKTAKSGAVDRLTDTSKYTGSHRERFDESGQGRGLDGRKDFDGKASAGYVGAYKEMGTYDKKH